MKVCNECRRGHQKAKRDGRPWDFARCRECGNEACMHLVRGNSMWNKGWKKGDPKVGLCQSRACREAMDARFRDNMNAKRSEES